MASTSRASFLQAIKGHDPQSTAIIHYPSGRRFSYGSLVADVFEEQKRLQEHAANGTLSGERIAFLIENSYDYVGAHGLVTSKWTALNIVQLPCCP